MAFHVNPGVDLLCDALENRYDRITEESDKGVTFQNDHRHYAGISYQIVKKISVLHSNTNILSFFLKFTYVNPCFSLHVG